jgi:hypothetical protein
LYLKADRKRLNRAFREMERRSVLPARPEQESVPLETPKQ